MITEALDLTLEYVRKMRDDLCRSRVTRDPGVDRCVVVAMKALSDLTQAMEAVQPTVRGIPGYITTNEVWDFAEHTRFHHPPGGDQPTMACSQCRKFIQSLHGLGVAARS